MGVSFRRATPVLLALLTLVLAGACAPAPRDDGSPFLMALSDRPAPAAPLAPPTPIPTRVAGASARAASTTSGASQTALVFLDPGHGGVDDGASGHTLSGAPVAEKNLTLAIALNVAGRLRQDGISVALSRTDDALPGATPADYTADGTMLTPDGVLADLQRRIDRANASGALVLLSIHFNAYSDPSIGGSETFYDAARPFAAQNERFANLVQSSLIGALRAAGYSTPDRGITDDSTLQAESLGALQGSYNHLVLLGPAVPGRLRPSEMPGALSEPMFVSNPTEATALATPEMQDLLAGAYVKAIEGYLRGASAQ